MKERGGSVPWRGERGFSGNMDNSIIETDPMPKQEQINKNSVNFGSI